ncbi:glycosyltransferase family 41 protein [Methylotenera sp.]|uniref:O-linked N-acetylglucosamine transferase, SPINDLY family protein n=1 Tax=Methylotenera sp. TaxID=2051956 RepID=UPI002734C16D|nr:glycosyltransferase family 41 protein [Methylotenera sp.]MDP3210669.1 tetratricopeptide repeat protein [Methylotenera sp.]
MANNEKPLDIGIAENNARIIHYLQTANYAEAEKLCAWLIDSTERPIFEPHFYLGVALQFQGKVQHALEVFKLAQALSPQSINVMQAIASCFDQLQRFEEAHSQLMLALAVAPQDDIVNANIGAILEKLKNPQEALSYYDAALKINPKNLTALLNRGSLLASLGRKLEGLAHCRRAHQIHPQAFGTLYNLADALLGLFRYDESLAYCEAGLVAQPRHANLLFKKGLVLSCLKQFDAAHQCLAEAQVIDLKVIMNVLPNINNMDGLIHVNLNPQTLYMDAMYQAQTKCFWQYRAEYIAECQQAILNPDSVASVVNNAEFAFQLLSLSLDWKTRLTLNKNLAEQLQDMAWLEGVPPFSHESLNQQPVNQELINQKLVNQNTVQKKPIRIGYFSSDFRIHPTGLLSKQIYALHDKADFEIVAYSTFNADVKDHVRQSVEDGCSVFRDVSALSDRQVAELIHQDKIEILVDFNGYTAKSRSKVMAMRPAPIQVSYLAYIQSMGTDFIDYAIVDSQVVPPKNESHWQEKLVKLPHCLYVYDTDTDCTPTHKTRQDYALPAQAFVFCCLNNCYKIEPNIFDVWMKLLHSVPDSVIWLLVSDELTQLNLLNEANARGIAKDRIIFAQSLPHAEHLLRYQLADLFIDTFWCGAHTTGLDALWQGLPVLSCVGDDAVSRVGASLLLALEMPELIAHDFAEYQEKAVYYATHPTALKALREKLQEKKMSAPLFNTAQTVHYIESAYKTMSARYRAGSPPISFDIPFEKFS